MAISPENCRAAFVNFIREWGRRLGSLEADVEANDVNVEIDGQMMPARNLLFWLRKDGTSLPAECCKFLAYPEGTTYGEAARALKAELVDRRRRMYVVKLENPSSPYLPYALASTTDTLAIEEAKSLFEPEGLDLPVFNKGETAVIWHLGRKVSEIRHENAGNLEVVPPH